VTAEAIPTRNSALPMRCHLTYEKAAQPCGRPMVMRASPAGALFVCVTCDGQAALEVHCHPGFNRPRGAAA
jgi:hypothetical protein